MNRTTLSFKRFQTACLLSLAALSLAAAFPASAASVTTYNNAGTFISALQSSYLENFNSIGLGAQLGPMNFSGNSYSYSVDVPSDSIYIIDSPSSPGDHAFSTANPDFSIVFTFASGIDSVGGNFFATDAPGNVSSGVITILLNDGTTQVLTNPAGSDFSGFISSGADISSLTVSSSSADAYATVDNYYVGRHMDEDHGGGPHAAAPEPQSFALLLGGIGAFALRLRRRKA
jgi:hypothetical protein